MSSKTRLGIRSREARTDERSVRVVNKGLVEVTGHEGRMYSVTVKRHNGTAFVDCTRDNGFKCPGNFGHRDSTVCYHSLAAVVALAEEKGKAVSFCRNEADARRLSNLGGQVVEVRNANGRGRVWAVVGERQAANSPAPSPITWEDLAMAPTGTQASVVAYLLNGGDASRLPPVKERSEAARMLWNAGEGI